MIAVSYVLRLLARCRGDPRRWHRRDYRIRDRESVDADLGVGDRHQARRCRDRHPSFHWHTAALLDTAPPRRPARVAEVRRCERDRWTGRGTRAYAHIEPYPRRRIRWTAHPGRHLRIHALDRKGSLGA